MVQIAIAEEHGADMKKRFYFYATALKEYLDILGAEIQSHTDEMAELALKMIPPYPLIKFETSEASHGIPTLGLIVESAMEQAVKDIKNISETEWRDILKLYKDASTGKGVTQSPEQELDQVPLSNRILELSETICSHIEVHEIAFPYIGTGKTPSHKITTFIAVIHAANRIVALKAEQN